MRTAVILLALVANAAAFKFLSNFKAASLIPRPSAMLKKRKAAKVYGTKKLAVITGASSGVGLKTAAELLRTGEYHVFGAARDMVRSARDARPHIHRPTTASRIQAAARAAPSHGGCPHSRSIHGTLTRCAACRLLQEKMRSVANEEDFSPDDFTPLEVDLNSFDSVREFCSELKKAKLNRPIDRMICNAAVYQPGDVAEWSADGHPQTMQVNFLSHFLMISLLFTEMIKAASPSVMLVGGTSAAGASTAGASTRSTACRWRFDPAACRRRAS